MERQLQALRVQLQDQQRRLRERDVGLQEEPLHSGSRRGSLCTSGSRCEGLQLLRQYSSSLGYLAWGLEPKRTHEQQVLWHRVTTTRTMMTTATTMMIMMAMMMAMLMAMMMAMWVNRQRRWEAGGKEEHHKVLVASSYPNVCNKSLQTWIRQTNNSLSSSMLGPAVCVSTYVHTINVSSGECIYAVNKHWARGGEQKPHAIAGGLLHLGGVLYLTWCILMFCVCVP